MAPTAYDAGPAGYGPRTAAYVAARRRRLIVGRSLVALVSVLMLLFTGFVRIVTDNAGQHESGLISACLDSCRGTTILLVGSDARVDAEGNPLTAEELAAVATDLDGGGVSTDTMMLIHIPADGSKATGVSIPRDTWIASPPQGPSDSGDASVDYLPNKVNSYYGSAKFYTAQRLVGQGMSDRAEVERQSSNAGRAMLITVLETFTGIHIDQYAEVNLFGFYLLSNAIGGVPVCLNAAVDDSFSGAQFAAGEQTVQGTAALSFVRQRHGLPNGDLDRIRRQQAFLAGAISKILSVGTLTDPAALGSLIDAANRSIVLSSGFDLLDLAQQISAISTGNITFETIPTHGAVEGIDKDALLVDVAEVQAMFDTIENGTSAGTGTPSGSGAASTTSTAGPVTADPASITVDAQNGTTTTGLAGSTSDLATAAGFTVGEVGNFPGTATDNQQATTTIRFPTGGDAAAAQVQAALGFGTVQQDDGVAAGHVLVVVGLDRVGAGLRGEAAAAATDQATDQVTVTGDAVVAATPGCVN